MSFLLVLVMVLGMMPAMCFESYADDWAPSGSCGANLTWTIKDSTLIISGTGGMNNYRQVESKKAPWYSYRYTIYDVTIEEGVTSIGSFAFEDMRFTDVILPNSITSIGEHAFADCGSLNSITM